jgi:hypothetical protein
VTATPPPQCSIALWRGYVTARFYVRGSNGGVFAQSPAFRTWRVPWQPAVPMREDRRAVSALDELKAELRARGWVRMRREPGSDWYEFRFRLGRGQASNKLRDLNGSGTEAAHPSRS